MKLVGKMVHDLSRNELDELKVSYYYQLRDNDDEVPFAINNGDKKDVENIESPSEIPDDVIFNHYNGIMFVDDDFFCNLNTEEQ